VRHAEAEVRDRTTRLLALKGKRTVDSLHRELGLLMWNHCGMARNEAGLRRALVRIPELREEFWHNVVVVDGGDGVNQSLEKAGRVADFLELAELICVDALHRRESCGGHFREESQTEDREAKRDDQDFCYAAAWEHTGDLGTPALHREPLVFENIALSERSYK
jgi:succinate dehydrogenase / fumarate reductase flavoprotein subunit